ncbi:MAG: hypothetical protein HZB67_01900 [Candidatus Aenigmarchaeota archaeon]|nr:hypothetical protein [Candidatus Aenigmarchaeota archaeon]
MSEIYNGILARYGEIFLKGDIVRRKFEGVLLSNLQRGLKDADISAKVRLLRGRLFVEISDIDSASNILARTFGIVSYSPVIVCEKKYNEIKKTSIALAEKFKKGSFAVEARRSDKSFALNSQQIKEKIGNVIRKMGFSVDLTNPKNRLCIEVHEKCYVYSTTMKGPGGMPLGTAGCVAGFLRDRKDFLTDWMLMKRGAVVVILGKYDRKLLRCLQAWSVGREVRAARNIGESMKKCIAIATHRKIKTDMVVLNPLVGFSDKEIKEKISSILR